MWPSYDVIMLKFKVTKKRSAKAALDEEEEAETQDGEYAWRYLFCDVI